MQQPGEVRIAELFVGQPKFPPDLAGQPTHASAMPGGVGVLGIDRGGQRAREAHQQRPQFIDVWRARACISSSPTNGLNRRHRRCGTVPEAAVCRPGTRLAELLNAMSQRGTRCPADVEGEQTVDVRERAAPGRRARIIAPVRVGALGIGIIPQVSCQDHHVFRGDGSNPGNQRRGPVAWGPRGRLGIQQLQGRLENSLTIA